MSEQIEGDTITLGTAPMREKDIIDIGTNLGVDLDKTPATPEEIERSMELLDKALKHVDWSYKSKGPTERELGHKSIALAEKAFIGAGLLDEGRAGEIWEKHTLKPPSPELSKRLKDARQVDPRKGISDLTAGIDNIGIQRQHNDLSLQKRDIEKNMATWKINLGDVGERAEKFRRGARGEMLTPEPNKDDTGLHLLKSLLKGWRAGQDFVKAKVEGKKGKAYVGAIKEGQAELGEVMLKMKKFEMEMPSLAVTDAITNAKSDGLVGRMGSRMGGAGTMVKTALEKLKKIAVRDTIEITPGNKPAIMASMAQQSQSRGL